MKKATTHDKALVIELLTRSFEDNQSVNFIVRQDSKKADRIRALMNYSFDICLMFGEVWLADDQKACALILYPDWKTTTIKSIWLDINLIIRAIGISGISKTLNREAGIKKKQLQVPMLYLWFIGVNTLYQHQGTGGKLLQEVLNHASSQSRPIFLETSVLRNIAWYERFGFQVYDRLELGYTLYFLNNLPA